MRQLIIAVDAMEWDLILRWGAEGKLPNLQRLINEGTRAELTTTAAQLPDTVWPSMFTGRNPGAFEKYFYVQYDPSTLGLRHAKEEEITAPPFWRILSDAGKRVGVVDAPKYGLEPSLHGFQVANWGAHASSVPRSSLPGELIGEIDKHIGRHPVGECDAVDHKPLALEALRSRILDGVRLHGELFRWLMQREDWDVFFATFSEAHCMGHQFFLDDPQKDDPLEQVYRAIDAEIGKMIALAGEGTRCMIVSVHGMGPLRHASWNLPEILDLLGYGAHPASGAGAPHSAKVNPWRLLKMMIPSRLQYAIKSALPKRMQDQLLYFWYRGGRTWKGSRAFAIPNNDSVGAIRIAVRGRDRGGMVEAGAEYRAICQDIREALEELTDPVSGRRVVRLVTLSSELFHGLFLDRLPDITVQWEQDFVWNSVHSPRIGTLGIRKQDARTGSHTPHGFLLLKGEDVAAGELLEGYSIYDIAPTILEAAGVPIPPDWEGRPLPVSQLR